MQRAVPSAACCIATHRSSSNSMSAASGSAATGSAVTGSAWGCGKGRNKFASCGCLLDQPAGPALPAEAPSPLQHPCSKLCSKIALVGRAGRHWVPRSDIEARAQKVSELVPTLLAKPRSRHPPIPMMAAGTPAALVKARLPARRWVVSPHMFADAALGTGLSRHHLIHRMTSLYALHQGWMGNFSLLGGQVGRVLPAGNSGPNASLSLLLIISPFTRPER